MVWSRSGPHSFLHLYFFISRPLLVLILAAHFTERASHHASRDAPTSILRRRCCLGSGKPKHTFKVARYTQMLYHHCCRHFSVLVDWHSFFIEPTLPLLPRFGGKGGGGSHLHRSLWHGLRRGKAKSGVCGWNLIHREMRYRLLDSNVQTST